MRSAVRFSCTALPASANKKGVIMPDQDGLYTVVVGGLNVFNSAGDFYAYDEAKALFEESSIFMRRVRKKALRGELGHPKRRIGESDDSYMNRLMTIYEDNEVCTHAEISLDFDSVKDERGNRVIAIISRLEPSGPHGEGLRKALESPNQNVCFSIRAFTDDIPAGGFNRRILKKIVTFDKVNEPGIAFAEKFKSPALEAVDLVSEQFTRGQIERSVAAAQMAGTATESLVLSADELFTAMQWKLDPRDRPAWANGGW